MGLKDISSKEAVLRAVAEYDSLGQDAFLSKYGFKRSRDLVLALQDKYYDSKAILGAAHGFEFPEQGPLKFNDFHGGRETIKKLEDLGFSVKSRPSVVEEGAGPRAWAFQCSPEKYRMLEAMYEIPETTFWARQSAEKIAVGDKALIWVAGEHSGGYALGEVVAPAQKLPEDPGLVKYWVDPAEASAEELRVRIRIDRLLFLRPLLRGILKEHPTLSQLLIMRQAAGTVFAIQPREWALLEVTPTREGAAWLREELLLALELFFVEQEQPGNRQDGWRKLARLLDRAPDAVGYALTTFKAFATPGKGLGNASKGVEALWKEYGANRVGLHHEAEAILKSVFAGGGLEMPKRYWKISPSNGAALWDWCREKGLIGTGSWGAELGDVSSFAAGDQKSLVNAYAAAVADVSTGEAKDRMRMLWSVLHDIRPGDVVVANDGQRRVVGRGRVTGTYRFLPGQDICHAVPVEWFDTSPREIPQQPWLKAVMELSTEKYRELFPDEPEAAGHGAQVHEVAAAEGTAMAATSIYDFLESKGLHFPRELVTSYLISLKTKPFVILSGISGTGKTKLAEYVAEWAGRGQRTVTSAPVEAQTEEVWHYVMRPYTLKNRKIVVARDFEAQFLLPELGTRTATIKYGGESYKGSLGKGTSLGRELHELRLGVPLTERLKKDVKVDDVLRIRVEESFDEGEGVVSIERAKTPLLTTTETFIRHDFVSVRPDWLDNKGILGFFNLLSERYVTTPFLKRLIAAFQDEQDEGEPHFITLDEMNLARVEHYFSDLLSVAESRKPDGESVKQEMLHLHDQERCEPILSLEEEERPGLCNGCPATLERMKACGLHPEGIAMVPPKMPVPTNVFITGTVNVDETTHMFSPKVLDRANVIEFNEVRLGGIQDDADAEFQLAGGTIALRGVTPAASKHYDVLGEPIRAQVETLHALLEPFHLHFGYRVANEIGLWLANAEDFVGAEQLQTALDLQVLQKVLPKLHGTKQKLFEPLWTLLFFASGTKGGATDFKADLLAPMKQALAEGKALDVATKKVSDKPAPLPRSAKKLLRMVKRLNEQGFVSFIE